MDAGVALLPALKAVEDAINQLTKKKNELEKSITLLKDGARPEG